jgi:type IV pilus biogenesis protein PilP
VIKVSSSDQRTTVESPNTTTPSNNDTDPTDEQESETTIEVVSVYEQDGKLYASLRDGSQLADVTVGDTFNGYQVVAIDLQKNQVTLAQDGKTVVLNNNQITK